MNQKRLNYDYKELPYWLKNLNKAWIANKKAGALRRATRHKVPVVDVTNHTVDSTTSLKHYLMDYQPEYKPKLGRPRLPSEELKQPKIKRSEQMRQLLLRSGIEVLNNCSLEGHEHWFFLPNGRVRYKNEPSISAHEFLSKLNAK